MALSAMVLVGFTVGRWVHNVWEDPGDMYQDPLPEIAQIDARIRAEAKARENAMASPESLPADITVDRAPASGQAPPKLSTEEESRQMQQAAKAQVNKIDPLPEVQNYRPPSSLRSPRTFSQ